MPQGETLPWDTDVPQAAIAPAVTPTTPQWLPPRPRVRPPRVWGVWATLGWTVLAVLVGMVLATMLGCVLGILLGLLSASSPQAGNPNDWIAAHRGTIELGAYLPAMGAILTFLMIPILVRRFRYSWYMGLTAAPPRWYAIGLGAIIAYLGLEEGLMLVTGRTVSPWMIQTWETCGSLLLLLAVVLIAAPLGEEMVFRGFLYRGLAATRFGAGLAIVLTSLLWTAIHIQYGPSELTFIFIAGLLLGWVRHASGSVGPPIVMHVVMNLIAVVLFVMSYGG